MKRSTGAVQGDFVHIWSNGYLSKNVKISKSTSGLTVYARGQYAGNAWPKMKVTLGNKVLGTVKVGSDKTKGYFFEETFFILIEGVILERVNENDIFS